MRVSSFDDALSVSRSVREVVLLVVPLLVRQVPAVRQALQELVPRAVVLGDRASAIGGAGIVRAPLDERVAAPAASGVGEGEGHVVVAILLSVPGDRDSRPAGLHFFQQGHDRHRWSSSLENLVTLLCRSGLASTMTF